MNRVVKFFHEMFNPHCSHCMSEAELEKIEAECKNCDVLHQQLMIANQEKRDLLNRLIAPLTIHEVIEPKEVEPITSQTKGLSWKVRKELLEQEKRTEAQLLAKQKVEQELTTIKTKSIEQIEKELGLVTVEE